MSLIPGSSFRGRAGLRSPIPLIVAVATAGLLLSSCSSGRSSTNPRAESTTSPATQSSSTSTSPARSSTTVTTNPPPPTSTTAPPADAPTLGLKGAWFEGAGFGQVEPTKISLGGDPTGLVTSVSWSSWGASETTGNGTGWYVPSNASTAAGSYEQASVVSFDLGTCGDHAAYEQVEWYFAGEGQKFDPSKAEYACTEAYANSSTRTTLYNPWSSRGHLLLGTKVQGTLSSSGCAEQSAFDASNPNAWRCSLADGSFYDPCFAPRGASDVSQLACGGTPWSAVTLVNLAGPLAQSSWGTPTSGSEHPWAMLLSNGDECGIIEGTGLIKDKGTFNFACDYGYAAYPSTRTSMWTAPYLARGSSFSTSLPVVAAWS